MPLSGDESDYYPSLVPLLSTATSAEFIASLNQVRENVHQARHSRHKHQAQVAGVVTAIQGELMDTQKELTKETSAMRACMAELKMALTGGDLGGTGIVAQIAANTEAIAKLTAATAACREESSQKHAATDAALKPLVLAAEEKKTAAKWYMHPAVIACSSSVAVSIMVNSGAIIEIILKGMK